jgi:hypothetical protein
MASSTTPIITPSNTLINETATHDYMRQFVDYLDNGIDFTELSEIRQLDICLQSMQRICPTSVQYLRLHRRDESRVDTCLYFQDNYTY